MSAPDPLVALRLFADMRQARLKLIGLGYGRTAAILLNRLRDDPRQTDLLTSPHAGSASRTASHSASMEAAYLHALKLNAVGVQ